MNQATLHVIGAGLAGLAAATRASAQGWRIVVHEGANHAGGRCRSYFDKELGCRIDNGNHLMLSANRAALEYMDEIGARDTIVQPDEPVFPFYDRQSGERWTVRPNRSRIPWWVLAPARRVPGTQPYDYLAPIKLSHLPPDATVAQGFDTGSKLYRRLWEPFAVAALNTRPDEAAARPLWNVMRESFLAGGDALFPILPREGLSESLIDPALATLALRGATVRFNARLREVKVAGDRVSELHFTDGVVSLDPEDHVVLAVPAQVATEFGLGITGPSEFRAIVNGHFLLQQPPTPPGFIGLVGGFVEWVFVKQDVISTTISAADRVIDWGADELASAIWTDVTATLGLDGLNMPAWRVVKEKRATYAATPAEERKRPGTLTRFRNLVLAGDWTATGLPATIEGAIRSGHRAAAVLAGRAQPYPL